MGGVRKDVKAPGVVNELVPREPYVALFGDEADQQDNHNGEAQSKGGEQHKPVPDGIEHPDTPHLLAGGVESGGGAQPDGVEEHSVKVPARQSKGDVDGKFGFVAVNPGTAFFRQLVLQFF